MFNRCIPKIAVIPALFLVSPLLSAMEFDFDGDGLADVAIYDNSNGTFDTLPSSTFLVSEDTNPVNTFLLDFQDGDIPITGDFDGDGIWDVGVRRPSSYQWFLRYSSTGEIITIEFGRDEQDIPVVADYDGDGISDIAVRRPSTHFWYIRNSSGVDGISGKPDGITRIQFGRNENDIPITGDFDGDGKADIAVRRPATFTWYIRNSSNTNFNSDRDDGIQRVVFGRDSNDIPVPADYDGDNITDIAVRRPKTFTWYIRNSSGSNVNSSRLDGIQRVVFGRNAEDIPAVADYDGDGIADIAVRRASNQTFYIKNSTGTNFNSSRRDDIQRIVFGDQNSDVPLAAQPNQLFHESQENDGPPDEVSDPVSTIDFSNSFEIIPGDLTIDINLTINFLNSLSEGDIAITDGNNNQWSGILSGTITGNSLMLEFTSVTFTSGLTGEVAEGAGEISTELSEDFSTLNISFQLSANNGANQFSGTLALNAN